MENAQNKSPPTHTPGPWAASTIYVYAAGNVEDGAPLICKTGSLKSQQDISDRGVQEANARLIAAAPDLLGVLKELYSCVTPDVCDDLLAIKVKAAIAKATGGAA